MADARQAWMPWRRVEDPREVPWEQPLKGQPLDGGRWWTALAVGTDVVGLAAVWREAAGFVGWVNDAGPTQQATHATEREAMQWCQDRLRDAARQWTGGSMAQH